MLTASRVPLQTTSTLVPKFSNSTSFWGEMCRLIDPGGETVLLVEDRRMGDC